MIKMTGKKSSNKKANQLTKNKKSAKEQATAAGGWDALKAVAVAIADQMELSRATKTLLLTNQPDGFDCPGCAWPDKNHNSSFKFCENGAKAVTWEATKKRATPALIGQYSVTELLTWTDHDLENLGRLTHPMRYDAATDRFIQVDWQTAFEHIAKKVHQLPVDSIDFYASGRASNEAAFLYQLFARSLGVNNFPDCSNMCHEPTSVGLPLSIGQGKGSVSLDDFDKAELIISIGHNPGSNHPRMMEVLHNSAKRGIPIVVLNPLKESSLERFIDPQSVKEMLSDSGVRIASHYMQVRSGGDIAAIKGVIKVLLARDKINKKVLDHEFISQHVNGLEKLIANIDAISWDEIENQSGLAMVEIETIADLYQKSSATIIAYGMGITQHVQGTSNVRVLCDLLLLKGNIGKQGAGICPLRGHSNVQGNRTVGITEKPNKAFLLNLGHYFHFTPPQKQGRSAVSTLEAILKGKCQALFCLGGNFPVAMPDPLQSFPAMKRLDLAVHVSTKLNRSHLLTAKETIVLPCLGRTEQDKQRSGLQAITVEDSMSMVHASMGHLSPASDALRSEVAIICGIAKTVLPNSQIDWQGLCDDYSKIREAIEAVLPDFANFNQRIKQPGGFRLSLPATERIWNTQSGKAEFSDFTGVFEDPAIKTKVFRLVTIRSHDQYNTSIYSYTDRYRGILNQRDVLLMNQEDIKTHKLNNGGRVRVMSDFADGIKREIELTLVEYDIAAGTVAAYYPEANVLISANYYDEQAQIPAYKSIPVRVALT